MKLYYIFFVLINSLFPTLTIASWWWSDYRRAQEVMYYEDLYVLVRGTFTCPRTPFCAVVYYYVNGIDHNKESAVYIKLHCSKTTKLHHEAVFNAKRFAWDADGEYINLRIKIFHDCVDIGILRATENDLGPIDRTEEYQVISYTESLKRRGVLPYHARTQYYYSHLGFKEDPVTTHWARSGEVTEYEHLYKTPKLVFT